MPTPTRRDPLDLLRSLVIKAWPGLSTRPDEFARDAHLVDEAVAYVVARTTRAQRDEYARLYLEHRAHEQMERMERDAKAPARQALREWREQVREAERIAEGAWDALLARKAAIDTMAAVAGLDFRGVDSERVSWADATVADHRHAIEDLVERQESLEADIRLHEEAIALLQASGRATWAEFVELGPVPVAS